VTLQNDVLADGEYALAVETPSPASQGQPDIDSATAIATEPNVVASHDASGAHTVFSGTPIRTAAKLGSPGYAGGPGMQVILPQAGSPALGAADPAVAPATDERGAARPSGGPTDLGAVQLSGAPPMTISIARPANGGAYGQGASIASSYACTPPAGVSLTSCSGPVASGVKFDTSTAGAHTFTVKATDGDGRSASSSVTYKVVSAADVRKLILSETTPTGKTARIGKILKNHGYTFTEFKAIEPGAATVAWYQVPPGAHLAAGKKKKQKPILVATGTVTFTAAGTAQLNVRLTNAGPKVLNRAGKRLTLTAKATFTPTGATAITITTGFRLKR
jgi:hypothetical protein